jgi:Protein of unknown function DUF262/Restriction Enzyme Adenine Methylase Associated/Protein of unknown function (DUF1524)
MGMTMPVDVERIDGTPRTIRELFTARKYGLDYYQREYDWSEANVTELLDDLSVRFLDEWDTDDSRRDVARYRPYFLGPIVTSNRGGTLYLVDGQQRLTTLTLLLVYLDHLQADRAGAEPLSPLVYSSKYGSHTFNLMDDEGERAPCMRAILEDTDFDLTGVSDSVRHIWQRYQDIERLFPEELKGNALLHFIDWLLERVALVEIAASDQDMALEIFETMNDRGLRLSAIDMLKGYLLSNIREPASIAAANRLWRGRVSELSAADRNAETDFIKNWLRSKFADSIRDRKKDAVPGDFDLIGTSPNKWLRDKRDIVGLRKPGDFASLVNRDFDRLSRRYLELLRASQHLTPGFEHVYYNAMTGFTLQFLLMLAAVTPVDDDDTFRAKVQMVAGFVDLYVARRMVNYRNFGYSTVAYTMFNIAKDIRDLDVDELADVLGEQVADLESFDGILTLGLSQRNGSHIKYLLARMTAFVDHECGTGLSFAEYMDRDRRNPFEIEHVWANHYERHLDEFDAEHEFDAKRNRLGGLLLLPKDFNASYNDATYPEKLPHYASQNLLAWSLHPLCYQHNPSFRRFAEQRELPFKSYPDAFTSEAISERQELYRRLCELIWDPARVGLRVPTDRASAEQAGKPHYGVSLKSLLDAGLLAPGTELIGSHSGHEYRAAVDSDGKIVTSDGSVFDTPSAAAMVVLSRSSWNGWAWWRAQTPDGLRLLSRLRQDLLERRQTRNPATPATP